MRKIIFHIDVNSAFLSWTAIEQLNNGAELDIREIPSIIGGDKQSRHGVVLAKSISAKKYGIKTGEPVVNALKKCPNLHMEPPNHKMYREYSHRMMEFLHTYTPDIEQVSVDECFLDFTGIAHQFHSPMDGAIEIKNKIKEMFGFTVNIGISSNKLLAKMASDFEKPDKVHTLFPEEIQLKMWPLPVSELYMAGKSSVETLKKLEIRTIGDLAKADPKILELHLKSHGRTLWEFAHGKGDDVVSNEPEEAKGIGNSTTLAKDITNRDEAAKVFLWLAESVGKRLRKAGQKAGMVSAEIRYHTFENVSHQRQLSKHTSNDIDIYHAAMELFDELWDGRPIRLLGIRSSKLVSEDEPEQMSLFDLPITVPKEKKRERMKKEVNTIAVNNDKQEKLNKALDSIKNKYGDNAIKKGTLL